MAAKSYRQSDLDNYWHFNRERFERAAAEHPMASLAQKMYRQASIREPDATRQHVSPLGGVAVASAPLRSSKEGSK
jgi:hypothetical protein